MDSLSANIFNINQILMGVYTGPYNPQIENNATFEIPAYQRPYRWGKDNIDTLFEDFTEFTKFNDGSNGGINDDSNSNYFLGAAVFVNNKNKNRFQIVDGQQRITTLFIIIFLKFIIEREICYQDIYTKKWTQIIGSLDTLKKTISQLSVSPLDDSELVTLINDIDDMEDSKKEDLYKKILDKFCDLYGHPGINADPDVLFENYIKINKDFYNRLDIRLKYQRPRYLETLINAFSTSMLRHVSNTMTYEIDDAVMAIDDVQDDKLYLNYKTAINTSFENIWRHCNGRIINKRNAECKKKPTSATSILDECDKFVNELLDNLQICVVITSNDDDATILFETLNDRSLEMEDLELTKNKYFQYFWKTMEKNNSSSNNNIDDTMTYLDELWVENIFSAGLPLSVKTNIAFCAAVYFVHTNCSFKNCKTENHLTKKINDYYLKDKLGHYDEACIYNDFEIYSNIRKIFEVFTDLKASNKYNISRDAELNNKSIVHRAFTLMYSLGYDYPLSALCNVILAYYYHRLKVKYESLSFDNYLQSLTKNTKSDIDVSPINKISFSLWSSCLLDDTYDIPVDIAKLLIKYNNNEKCTTELDLDKWRNELSTQFREWVTKELNAKRKHKIKILFIRLLTTTRTPRRFESCLDEKKCKLEWNDVCDQKLNVPSEGLDFEHLEPDSPESIDDRYFSYDDKTKRNQFVNCNLGNYCVLDRENNKKKSDLPFSQGMSVYFESGYKEFWPIRDIKEMMNHEKYFLNGLPTEEFFNQRRDMLIEFFIQILQCPYYAHNVDVLL